MTVRLQPPDKKNKMCDKNLILTELGDTKFINEFKNVSPVIILPELYR